MLVPTLCNFNSVRVGRLRWAFAYSDSLPDPLTLHQYILYDFVICMGEATFLFTKCSVCIFSLFIWQK